MYNRNPGKKFSQFFGGSGGSGQVLFKGEIIQPSDFPTITEVQTGWEYIINNPLGVTDNDPTKTNTGLTFPDQVFIIWTGSTWTIEGGESVVSDNGTDIIPVNPRGYNVPSGQTFKINDIDIAHNSGTPTINLGGFQSGVPYTNQENNEMWQTLLSPYQNPAFTSFALTGFSVLEVGQKITGTQNFTWSISNLGNAQANSINITDITNAVSITSGHSLTPPASYDFTLYPGGGLEIDTQAVVTFQIQGTNTHSAAFIRNVNIAWDWRVHSGANVNATLTNAQILALANSSLTTAFPPQVTFTGGTTYFWYWIPASFIQPTVFKNHATGFAIGMNSPVTQTVTNSYGIDTSYKGYRSAEQLDNAITVDIS